MGTAALQRAGWARRGSPQPPPDTAGQTSDPRMVPEMHQRFLSLLVSQVQGILKTEDASAGLITEHLSVTTVISITFQRLETLLSSQDPAPAASSMHWRTGWVREAELLGSDGATLICSLAQEGSISLHTLLTA